MSTAFLPSYVFRKAIGLVYLIAFLSFGVQAMGLIGSGGLLPIADYLRAVQQALGPSAFFRLPTILWLDSSDAMIRAVWIAGAIFSVAIILGALPRVSLAACFCLYLSIVSAGQSFMTFQWDFLLLEAGFLAIFLDATRPRVWLVRWLLFRLMFLSGAVKLASGDPTWRNLTALQYHYETQPLPTPIAWYMHLLPAWFQSASVVFVFIAELGAPLLLFAGRRIRLYAAGTIVALQLLIAATGNYTFFNWLAIALCLLAIDGDFWPRGIRDRLGVRAARSFPARWPRARVAVSIALVVILVPLTVAVSLAGLSVRLPDETARIVEWTAPFGVVNSYGLFANMTTTRPEIIIQASMDGADWREYEFKYKPGDVKREPSFVAPYQPRLDWQMWFAALGTYRENPFFINLMVRLLQARPETLALFRRAPFGRERPRYVRALVYQYHFTNWQTFNATRAWWTREYSGVYLPPVGSK